MQQLSKNFKDIEFACRHCGKTLVNPKLVSSLQSLRDNVNLPIHVLSGYRCQDHPEEAKYTKTTGKISQHTLGNAADIVIGTLSVDQMFEEAEKIEAFREGGIGKYPQNHFIHVDVRGTKARWKRINGRYMGLDEG